MVSDMSCMSVIICHSFASSITNTHTRPCNGICAIPMTVYCCGHCHHTPNRSNPNHKHTNDVMTNCELNKKQNKTMIISPRQFMPSSNSNRHSFFIVTTSTSLYSLFSSSFFLFYCCCFICLHQFTLDCRILWKILNENAI